MSLNGPIPLTRDSEGSSSVFAWPKETHRWDADATLARGLHNEMNHAHFGFEDDPMQRRFGDPLAEHLEFILHTTSPFPGEPVDDEETSSPDRFVAVRVSDTHHVLLDSAYDGADYSIASACLANPDFEPLVWFAMKVQASPGRTIDIGKLPRCPMGDPDFHPRRGTFLHRGTRFHAFLSGMDANTYVVEDRLYNLRWPLSTSLLDDPRFDVYRWVLTKMTPLSSTADLELNGVQIPSNQYAALQRNAARVKDPGRRIARPLVIVVRVNGHPVTALLDSGSFAVGRTRFSVEDQPESKGTVPVPVH
ncbi:hypothetical protein EV361DRAFT_929836 [Lentinula raphanica]|nr:hypothetical protein EV361DRAFT_929836 [Lentinula raphanica]